MRHCHGMTIARNGPVALLVLLLVVGCSLVPGGGTPDLDGRAFLSTSIAVDGMNRDLVAGTIIRLGFARWPPVRQRGLQHVRRHLPRRR